MTRDEWLNWTDPLEMVNAVAGKLTDRKLRLFLVACCRRLGHLPAGPGLRDAASAAERFADGACGQEEMERAAQAAGEEVDSANQGQPWLWLTKAGGAVFVARLPQGYLGSRYGSDTGRYMRGSYVVMRGVDAAAEAAARLATSVGEGNRDGNFEQALAGERAEQCRLLRDVAGDPFRPAEFHPSWLAWNGGTVVKLAQSIYQEKSFEDMPVLADALEEAGCTNADILAHCRQPGEHVRGCWVIDALLGKS